MCSHDSRSLHEDKFDSIDLVISNGLENYLYHMNKVKNLIYPTYQEFMKIIF